MYCKALCREEEETVVTFDQNFGESIFDEYR